METVRGSIWMDMEKFLMCASNGKSETVFRIWDSGFLFSQMTGQDDTYTSLKERAEGCAELKAQLGNKKGANREACAQIACREWMDVRAFGQVFAFKGSGENVSLGVRGPVSIHQAVSLSPVDIISMQITKSVNSESGKGGKASDTMGMKHRVGFAVYKVMGSVNVQLAEKTGFSQEDAEVLKEASENIV